MPSSSELHSTMFHLNFLFGFHFPKQAKDLPTFKDIDFLTENNRIIIGNEAKDEVLAKLKADSEVIYCKTSLVCYYIVRFQRK